MNGTHRDTGVLLLSAPTPMATPSLADIAPTVLAVLGVPCPPMDGRSLLGGDLESRALDHAQAPFAFTEEEEIAMTERMRALGYWE